MIPLDKKLPVFKNQTLDLPEILGGNATIPSESYRLQPKLALAVRGPNVDVGGLARLIRVKVKSVRAYPQHGRHNLLQLPRGNPRIGRDRLYTPPCGIR